MTSELLSQSITQWIALITGIAYVVLAAREKPICWLFGIVSCACIAWDDFNTFRLYADGVLQLVYIALGFVGLYQWLFGRYRQQELAVHTIPLYHHVITIAAGVLISLPVYHLLAEYTDAAYGFADTLTTVMSLYATWLLARKVLSTWLYWVVIDVIYVFLFYRTGGHLVAVLYAVFTVVSVYGYFNWRRNLS